jgi:PAS domain S-box-containing protein
MYKDYAGKHKIDMYAELMKCIKTGNIKEFPEQKYEDRFLYIKIAPFQKGAIITSQDITERKKEEEELRVSEEKYRTFLENLPDIVYELRLFKEDVTKEEKEKILGYINEIKNANEEMLDNVIEKVSQELIPYLDLSIIYVNQRALEIMGYSKDTIGKITSPEVMVPEQRAKVIKNIFKNFTGKIKGESEYELIKINGESIAVSTNTYQGDCKGYNRTQESRRCSTGE